ncbi:MFS transporter [Veronia nyctiphanis]|uniref:MFS transporter n=1 Tax=Veronia nyctiphanis TaxID=1278244 RepID=A0A4V1LRV2_9GAMM|nr:MFS transporter [Veronia nyctiphanis]RXJ69488.1 MFS transporter [Veronia nyctiphanis]
MHFGLIIISAMLILAVNMGLRQALGIFLPEMGEIYALSMPSLSFAFAFQNLLWGAIAPFAGVLAERHGYGKVLFTGSLIYSLGTALLAVSESAWVYHLSNGVLLGIGVGATTFSVVLGAVSKNVSDKHRSVALGIASAGGSLGQFIYAIAGNMLNQSAGYGNTMLIFAVTVLTIPLLMLPLSKSKPSTLHEKTSGTPFKDKNFILLTSGFFVCGFHVAFISVHLPNYAAFCGLSTDVAATSLAIIGLCNVFGTIAAGWLGGRFHKPYLLSSVYMARALLILMFFLSPKSAANFYWFSVIMGMLWLSTVPLTSGSVAQLFGAGKVASIFGWVMFGHQVGAFVAVYSAGWIVEKTGGYDMAWYLSVGLGVIAAVMHLPMNREVFRQAQKNHVST